MPEPSPTAAPAPSAARPAQRRPSLTRLPQDQWRICIPNVYPAYISWETYTQIQAMLKDNHAEYDRNKTRGIPRPGKALLHGLVYCGECGHKMVVQYKGGTRYICNYLRQQYRTPVCQYIAADPVDTRVVDAFFQALSPVELDVYAQALAKRQQQAERIAKAQAQHLERLRYEAAYCERQFRHVDPAHRHVAAELEHAWEVALQALKQAEAAHKQRAQSGTPPETALSPTLQAAFRAIGHKLPELWPTDVLSQAQRKALLRCLIDKVVIQRARRDQIHTRIVWRGGETTTFEVPVAVGALTDLPTRARDGATDSGAVCRGQKRRRDGPPADPARLSLAQSARGLAQHGQGHPPQAGPHAESLAVAPTTDRRVPDGAATGQGVGYHPALGVSPDQARHGGHPRDAARGSISFPTAPRRWRRLGSYGRAIAARCATERHRAPRGPAGAAPSGRPAALT